MHEAFYHTTIFSENDAAHSVHNGQTLKGLIVNPIHWSSTSDVMYCTTWTQCKMLYICDTRIRPWNHFCEHLSDMKNSNKDDSQPAISVFFGTIPNVHTHSYLKKSSRHLECLMCSTRTFILFGKIFPLMKEKQSITVRPET